MSGQEFDNLFQKYLSDKMTPEELLRWKQLMQDDTYAQQLEAALEQLVAADQSDAGMDAPAEKMYRHIAGTAFEQRKPVRMRRYIGWAAAAAVVLLAGAGIFVQFFNNGKEKTIPGRSGITTALDALPGSNGAVLTLADGKKIILDSLQNGVIAMEDNSKAVLENGSLRYDAKNNAGMETRLNTITTSRGRQFQLILPDGSRAWLNAASSLTYPTSFTGNDRKVQVAGEVYFEVAKQKNKPFKVQTPGQSYVEVTGTRFNVNAYADEPSMATTLAEGAVNVHVNNGFQTLKPGQQAQVKQGQLTLINNADTSQVLAWKNGIFDMNNAGLPAVMRQLARWYDVNIEYEREMPDIRFGGKMQRNLKLSQVLNGLSGMGVQFRIEEGRKLIVY